MPQSATVRGLLAQFSAARQADESSGFYRLSAFETVLEKQRDQLPLFAPVMLGLGIIAWQTWGSQFGAAIYCAIFGVISLSFFGGMQFRTFQLLFWAALLIGLGFGAIALKSEMVAATPLQSPRILTFNGRIESVEDVSAREIVRYRLKTGQFNGLPETIRVNIPLQHHRREFQSGAIIRLKARLMPPPGPAIPRGYDFSRQAWFSGIGATGSALGPPTLVTPSQSNDDFWSSARESLSSYIRAAMPEGTGAIGAALLVGTRGAISENDAQALRNSGMAHLLSVSGLHVSAVVGGAFFLISRLLALFPFIALRFAVPLIAASGAALIAVCYTLLTGAEVPTIRACIAALLILIALAMGREALSLRLLATGAFAVLLFWPESLAGPSFQLSFSAVATIIILHESPLMQRFVSRRDEPMLFRMGRLILSLLITGAAIELALAPIALFHFHKSGVYGSLANIVAIPLTTFFIMPLQLLGLVFDQLGLGAVFWWLAGQGVAIIIAIAHLVSGAPGAVLALPAMPYWAFAALVGGALWCAILKGRPRLWGLVPILLGAVAAFLAPYPDMLVTGDGRHLAIVEKSGELILLRPGAGDYALSMLSENAATMQPPIAIDAWDKAQCSSDICTFLVHKQGRNWTILATRTHYLVPSMELAAACKRVDIVVSERYLPMSCKPRWFKADRGFFDRHGGLAIYFDRPRVESVADGLAHQPWSTLGPKQRTPKRPLPTEGKSKI